MTLADKRISGQMTGRYYIYEEDVKEFIKELIQDMINDWEFCKKANVEPHIHPRRVIEYIHKRAGDELA